MEIQRQWRLRHRDEVLVKKARSEIKWTLGAQKERKKENRQPKGGMGGRYTATTQGF